MAGSEIQSTIFVSRYPAMQNIYLTFYKQFVRQNTTQNVICCQKWYQFCWY